MASTALCSLMELLVSGQVVKIEEREREREAGKYTRRGCLSA